MRVSLRHALARGLFAACLLGLAGSQASARPFTVNRSLASARAPEAEAEGKKEGRELLYKFINVSLLVGALAYVLRKPLAEFFARTLGCNPKRAGRRTESAGSIPSPAQDRGGEVAASRGRNCVL